MYKGTKNFFGKDYEDFKKEMIEAANDNELPVSFQYANPLNLTFEDIDSAFIEFEFETGLSISGNISMCQECGFTHLEIVIDYPKQKTILQ